MKILIMGLPGSGKTYLTERLQPLLKAAWYNADKIREMANDWDFSDSGRKRQSMRMRAIADYEKSCGRYVLCDFICPTKETRKNFQADLVIWMDTISESRFDDTNKIFEAPVKVDFHIKEWNDHNHVDIAEEILKMFDPKKPTVQMLGRWQPWHDGHQELFKRCIAKTGQVIIQVRDVQGVSGGIDQDDNPFDWNDVCKNIENGLLKDGYKRGIEYEIMLVPNIVNITFGRGVGYKFEEEIFDESVSAISATKIREQLRSEGKLD